MNYRYYLAAILLLFTGRAYTDTIFLFDSVLSGHVTEITKDEVQYIAGCNGKKYTSQWEDIESLEFSDNCDDVNFDKPIGIGSGGYVDCDEPVYMFLVRFATRGGKLFTYSNSIEFDNEDIILELVSSGGQKRGRKSKIRSVEQIASCNEATQIEDATRLPSSFK